MKKIIDLDLPEILFLDGHCHLGDTIAGRTLLLDVRTASVVEIFNDGEVVLKEGVPSLRFSFVDKFGLEERLVAAAHYVHGGMGGDDLAMEVLERVSDFYVEYTDWEDTGIAIEDVGRLN